MLETVGPTARAGAVHEAMLDHPALGVDQLAAACDLSPTQVHDGPDELAALMPVRASSEHPGQMRAVSPEIALADIHARQEAELAARQARPAASRATATRKVADRAEHRTTAYAHWLLGLGSEIRTAPVIPQRLVIVERTQALVPVDPADTRKGVTEPGLLTALLDLFDSAWTVAVPSARRTPPTPAAA